MSSPSVERSPVPERSARAGRVGVRIKLVIIASAAIVVSINIWTGAPILALWIGSRAVPESGLSLGAIILVLFSLGAFDLALLKALLWLNDIYGELSGAPVVKKRAAWLLSVGSERQELLPGRRVLTTVERVVAFNVVLAVMVFEIWFFFFAHMTLPS